MNADRTRSKVVCVQRRHERPQREALPGHRSSLPPRDTRPVRGVDRRPRTAGRDAAATLRRDDGEFSTVVRCSPAKKASAQQGWSHTPVSPARTAAPDPIRSAPHRPEALGARLEEARANGWSYDDGEYEEISNCVAAPVHGRHGHPRRTGFVGDDEEHSMSSSGSGCWTGRVEVSPSSESTGIGMSTGAATMLRFRREDDHRLFASRWFHRGHTVLRQGVTTSSRSNARHSGRRRADPCADSRHALDGDVYTTGPSGADRPCPGGSGVKRPTAACRRPRWRRCVVTRVALVRKGVGVITWCENSARFGIDHWG
ncbi:IclR family transcriptional regulator C-terminal domain-containing protein [Embleya sp. NPDC050493]|uniref:IclR family transcriptional regulator domain-containing protein n=1 Tax=Embleya sp. NPDC050493 TaxID=3363989 RepID=UPI0037A6CF5D